MYLPFKQKTVSANLTSPTDVIDFLMFYLFLLSCYQIRISGTRRSLDKIKKELDKCVILCANCHREEHERIRNN